MSNQAGNESRGVQQGVRLESPLYPRRRPLSVLFVPGDTATIECCLEKFEKAQFTVRSDFVLSLAECTERFQSQSYDVIVVEYPSAGCNGPQAIQFLHQNMHAIPVIFLTDGAGSECIAELSAQGMVDYVEREHIANLPMAVRRALKERKLREELAEAGKALRHSQSLCRALMENPAYGICRCDGEGTILDVNEALLAMLGYSSKAELLATGRELALLPDLSMGKPSAGSSPALVRIEPGDIEWKRKNGTTLKARLSGRGVVDEQGKFAGYEIIAVDITEQRALEDHLRHQALSDSLTGLANHRRLFEVLYSEISRSKRTEREFSLLLLDLDGLKEINDRFGHLVGNRALCRLGQIMADCCRSVDTAARQGGDEFALVLPETGAGAAALVATRICDLLAKDAEEPALSVSVGVASYPKDADTIGTLLYAADANLYFMKNQRPRVARAAHACGSEISVSNPSVFP